MVIIASDRGENQGCIGFIDGVKGGGDPMDMVVVIGGNRISVMWCFWSKIALPYLAAKLFPSDGSRWFAEKPSARGGENARES